MNEDIRKLYDELTNPQNRLTEDEFLEKLAKLESYTTINIYRTLLANKDKKTVRASKEYRALKGLNPFSAQQVKEDNKIRNRLEKKTINNLVGEKVSILDIINIYSKNINKILKQKIDIRKKLKELNIVYDEVEGTIFPPEGEERIITGSGKGVKEKEGFDRFSLLLEKVLNTDNGFYTGDYRVVIGNNRKNMMRKTSYIVIEIPKINKTIFVNNEYGEATFVYDGIPTDSEIQEKGKQSYKSVFKKIRFLDSVQWVKQVKEALNSTSEGKNKFKNVKASELGNFLDREEFIGNVRKFFEDNPKEKEKWLNADSNKKREELGIIINGKVYKGASIASRLIEGIDSSMAYKFFVSGKGYIEILKLLFGEDDEKVNAFIAKIEPDLKEDFTKKEFIEYARMYFENNPKAKEDWLSADSGSKRVKLEITINRRTYKCAAIVSRLMDGIDLNKAKDIFKSGTGYIEILKLLFGEDDERVNAFIKKIESNLKGDFTREEFIEYARMYFEDNPKEKEKWLSADLSDKRKELKIVIKGKPYKGTSIVSYLIDKRNLKSGNYFTSPRGYIEILKLLFGEDDKRVNALIKKIESNLKGDFTREEFIEYARMYFEDNPKEKEKWLSASSDIKRNELKISINGIDYKGAAVVSYLIDRTDSISGNYFSSPRGYIEILKLLFGKDDERVNALISKIESNLKENFTKKEFIEYAREFFKNDTEEKKAWLSADSTRKRTNLKITINGINYGGASIVYRLLDGIKPKRAKLIFTSPRGYIEILKLLFGEDDERVNALISKIESNLKEDFTEKKFIECAREFFKKDSEEKRAWLNADSGNKRLKLKIIIDGKTYKGASIVSRLMDGINPKKAKDFFKSSEGYISILKTIFGEDDPDVIKYISKNNLKNH